MVRTPASLAGFKYCVPGNCVSETVSVPSCCDCPVPVYLMLMSALCDGLAVVPASRVKARGSGSDNSGNKQFLSQASSWSHALHACPVVSDSLQPRGL